MIALRVSICVVACLLMAPVASVPKTWTVEILTAGDLNAQFTAVVNDINSIDDDNVSTLSDIDPTKLDAHQDNAAEGQVHTDPFGSDTQTLAATLAQELEQIRWQLRAISDQDNDNWFESMENVGFSTGDVKLTIKNAADVGWVMMEDDTIGDAGNNCDARSNADTEDLFALLWTNIVNVRTLTTTVTGITVANPSVITTGAAHGLGTGDRVRFTNIATTPELNNTFEIVTVLTTTTFSVAQNITVVTDQTGNQTLELLVDNAGLAVDKGASAAADFGAGDRCILLPRTLGRALAGADTVPGGTSPGQAAQAIGSVGGEHAHTLTTAEMPAHTHSIDKDNDTLSSGGAQLLAGTTADGTTATASTGGGASHNITGPITYLTVMIKL